MRTATAALLCLCCWRLPAQGPAAIPHIAVVRGVVLECDDQHAGGEFSVRLPDNEVLRYRFDEKTAVERDNYPIDVPRLHPGERVEVVSEAVPGSLLRLARTVHVILAPDPPSGRPRGGITPLAAPQLATVRAPHASRLLDDMPLWRGNLSFSGVVTHLGQSGLVLRTREGDRNIRLLPNTRYLENGVLVDAATLRPNMRVFILAGRNLNNEVEGYRVIWGQILRPE
jgi:hypothetical protein